MLPSLAKLRAELTEGKLTCLGLVGDSLRSIADENGEGGRTFIRVYGEKAMRTAEAADNLLTSRFHAPSLLGLPISIKDLFDVAGETTRAGSKVLSNAAPAFIDADVITRLRSAGAVIVGRTNMTEFAFSGLGLNPHYGTPRNSYDRSHGRIPGGSSSGAAVSVTDGMAVAAIGTDTGGSVRIPAALCGLTGFKPTAKRISLLGVLPLSPSLDSVGSIAPTVACCALLDSALSGSDQDDAAVQPLNFVRAGVLQGYVLDNLEQHVEKSFQSALSILSRGGAKVTDVELGSLPQIPDLNKQGGLAAVESYAWHSQLLADHGAEYDPRVRMRILRGGEISISTYRALIQARQEIIAEAEQAFTRFEVILSPTTPRIAPSISALEADDEAYFAANAAMLRNPSIVNFLDGCSLSIPCHLPGEAPVGLMVSALGGRDRDLLRIGRSIEHALAVAGCAIHGR